MLDAVFQDPQEDQGGITVEQKVEKGLSWFPGNDGTKKLKTREKYGEKKRARSGRFCAISEKSKRPFRFVNLC